jgi:hypothetical protein
MCATPEGLGGGKRKAAAWLCGGECIERSRGPGELVRLAEASADAERLWVMRMYDGTLSLLLPLGIRVLV